MNADRHSQNGLGQTTWGAPTPQVFYWTSGIMHVPSDSVQGGLHFIFLTLADRAILVAWLR